jgi:hypothetical protein
MVAYSSSIVLREAHKLLAQFIALGVRQIDLVAFGKYVEQEQRDILAGVERDHASSPPI